MLVVKQRMLAYIKRTIPISFSVSMLSTLIFMTFVQSYSLSINVPNNYFRSEAQCFSSICTKTLFEAYLRDLDVRTLNRYRQHLALNTETDIAPSVKEISEKLSKLTLVSNNKQTTIFNFQFKKTVFWEREIQQALLVGAEFKNTITRQDLKSVTFWKTDFLKLLFFFLTVFFTCSIIANAIHRRVKSESSE